jgi:hypothetical protein
MATPEQVKDMKLCLFTQLPRGRLLGSPHSPAPTPMSVPDSDLLPRALSQLLHNTHRLCLTARLLLGRTDRGVHPGDTPHPEGEYASDVTKEAE